MTTHEELMAALDAARPRHPLEDEGWVYVDPPGKFSPEMWEYFLDVFGPPENVLVLAHSSGTNNGAPWCRGQLMVSPAGQELLRAYKGRGTNLEQ